MRFRLYIFTVLKIYDSLVFIPIYRLQSCRYLSLRSLTLPSFGGCPLPFWWHLAPPSFDEHPPSPPMVHKQCSLSPNFPTHWAVREGGRGDNADCFVVPPPTHCHAPVNTGNTHMCRNCSFRVTTAAFDSITITFSISIVSNIFSCARVTYY